VVLEAGQVVEQGRHDDLLARGGRYAAMWAAQSDDDQSVVRHGLWDNRDPPKAEPGRAAPRAVNL
jgi:hypothetical protein